VVEVELEYFQVLPEVVFPYASKDSQPGFEEREYSFDGVGVSLAVHVLSLTMIQGNIVIAGKVVVDGEIVMVHFERGGGRLSHPVIR